MIREGYQVVKQTTLNFPARFLIPVHVYQSCLELITELINSSVRYFNSSFICKLTKFARSVITFRTSRRFACILDLVFVERKN